MPKVSVIVPVYNVEKYLRKCLDSLVNQTLEDIEIIIVNDGSPDASQDIIDEYVLKYPHLLKSIITENGGQGSARNYGIDIATGEYIGFVDSDDYVALDMYEKLYVKAKETDSDIVSCGNFVVNENGDIIQQDTYKNHLKTFTLEQVRTYIFDKSSCWNKIYKTKFLRNSNIRFRSKKWYEDFDFATNIALSTEKISIIEEALYYYLRRVGSTMQNSNVVRNEEILEAFDEILKFSKQNNLYDMYFNEIEYLALTRIYIATIIRIIRAESSKDIKRNTINKILTYVNNVFPNITQNVYIKTNLGLKRRILLFLLKHKWYSAIKWIFSFK